MTDSQQKEQRSGMRTKKFEEFVSTAQEMLFGKGASAIYQDKFQHQFVICDADMVRIILASFERNG
jgi:phosphoribosyl-AMP cyclohydrolase